jgi:hypothetical protein
LLLFLDFLLLFRRGGAPLGAAVFIVMGTVRSPVFTLPEFYDFYGPGVSFLFKQFL